MSASPKRNSTARGAGETFRTLLRTGADVDRAQLAIGRPQSALHYLLAASGRVALAMSSPQPPSAAAKGKVEPPAPEPELPPADASRLAQQSRTARLAGADKGLAGVDENHLTQMQIEVVQAAGQMIRGLACSVVGTVVGTRLPAYLPRAQEKEVTATLDRARQAPPDKLEQVAAIMEPVMGRIIASLAGDLRETFDGLIDEAIRERVPDDSTRCYVLLAVRVREAELAMTAVFPAEAEKILKTAHAEAAAARKDGAEEGEAKAERILAAADHRVSALGAAPLAAAKTKLNAAADAAKNVEPFYFRTQLCLSAQQAAMIYSAQERAQVEKDVSVGFRIMCGAPPHLHPRPAAQQPHSSARSALSSTRLLNLTR